MEMIRNTSIATEQTFCITDAAGWSTHNGYGDGYGKVFVWYDIQRRALMHRAVLHGIWSLLLSLQGVWLIVCVYALHAYIVQTPTAFFAQSGRP